MQNTNPLYAYKLLSKAYLFPLEDGGVKFTNEVHRYKFHWGWRGFKMEFIVFDHLFIYVFDKGYTA